MEILEKIPASTVIVLAPYVDDDQDKRHSIVRKAG